MRDSFKDFKEDSLFNPSARIWPSPESVLAESKPSSNYSIPFGIMEIRYSTPLFFKLTFAKLSFKLLKTGNGSGIIKEISEGSREDMANEMSA